MIEELTELIPTFPGANNRTRCFAHIINLVVKQILLLFDDNSDDAVKNTEKRLLDMTRNIDFGGSELDSDSDGECRPDRLVPVSVDDKLKELYDEMDFKAVRIVILPVHAVIAKVSW
jgi:hypothetical protein